MKIYCCRRLIKYKLFNSAFLCVCVCVCFEREKSQSRWWTSLMPAQSVYLPLSVNALHTFNIVIQIGFNFVYNTATHSIADWLYKHICRARSNMLYKRERKKLSSVRFFLFIFLQILNLYNYIPLNCVCKVFVCLLESRAMQQRFNFCFFFLCTQKKNRKKEKIVHILYTK